MGSGTNLKMNPPLLKGTKTNTYRISISFARIKRDSNPRYLLVHLLSRQTLSTTQPFIPLRAYSTLQGYKFHYISDFILNYYRLWDNRTRTYAWLHQKQLPYRLGYTPIIDYLLVRGIYTQKDRNTIL